MSGPTLEDLARVLGQVPFDARFNRTLAEFRHTVGDAVDLDDVDHVHALRGWLNKWGCRIAYPRGAPDLFVDSVTTWWTQWRGQLPGVATEIADLGEDDLAEFGRAFGDLSVATSARDRAGRSRRIGPTAASKVLWVLRPAAVAPWDVAIAHRRGADGWVEHQRVLGRWARDLREANPGVDVPARVDRAGTSVARILDEWCYLTVTRKAT
jgi:hypothetical protein